MAFVRNWSTRSGMCLVLMGLLAATSATAQDGADPPHTLFAFRNLVAASASHGVPPAHYEIICVRPLNKDLARGQTRLTILGEKGQGAELFVMSGFPIGSLKDLWAAGTTPNGNPLSAPLDNDPSTPPTPDWGWIYDRNGDGRVDWVAMLNGPIPVLPVGGFSDDFPKFLPLGAKFELTKSQLVTMLLNTQTAYYHSVDSDFDGSADTFLSKSYSEANGWAEGEMLVIGNPAMGGKGKCFWQSDYDDSDTARCAAEGDGQYRTNEGEPRRVSLFNFNRLKFFELFNLIAGKAAECDFAKFGIEARP